MSRIIKTFCDLCEKECDNIKFGVVSGCITKMNETGEMKDMIFEGHYCEDDIGKIIGFIEKEKNAQLHDSKSMAKPIEQGTTNKRT